MQILKENTPILLQILAIFTLDFAPFFSENFDIFPLQKHQILGQILMVFDVSLEQFSHAILPFLLGNSAGFRKEI